jgi:cation diffusion facilitator family transporter
MSFPPDACGHGQAAAEALQAAAHRRRQVRRVFWMTLWLNALVAVAKGSYGYVSGSLTLATDSLHSILDTSSNVLALLGLRLAAAPADERHPYGRNKVEILAALGIGVLIVIGLFELASSAVHGLLWTRPPPRIGWSGFAIVIATMVVNLFVSRYEHRKAHELGSALLHADARHTQSDLYASAAVVASFVAVRAGVSWGDEVATLLVVALVARVAWEVFRENVPVLIDAAILDPGEVAAVARSVAGVSDVHRIRSRGVPSAVELDLHMLVPARTPTGDAHCIAEEVERALKVKFPEVSDVIIHIEPDPQTHTGNAQRDA